ncbi:MAG: FAD-dependent oxidoreductase [Ruminococcaceae bacterium]|nr:FAD-dependent oxidoreductase [Oscillospiraceae bacterium]
MNIDAKKEFNTEVLVIGGGPAGVCAAISAARMGVKTLLVEQGGFSGGMATRGLVGPFMTCYDAEGKEMIIRGIFEEIVDRMVERGYAIHPSEVMGGTAFTSWIKIGHDHVTPFEAEGLKLILDEMLQEANVSILYHTSFLQPVIEQDTIKGAYVSSKAGIQLINAKVIIDCTGDGDVAARSGVPFEMGNEELGLIQPATMFYHISNVDSDKVEADIQANINNFYRKDGVNYRSLHWRVSEARENGDWTLDRVSIGLFRMPKKDEWCVNTSRIMGVDSTDNESLTKAEIEGRKQADEITRFFRKYVPGCEDARIKSTASHVGIRESRHIAGEYRLTADDLLQAKVPYDTVFIAANSVDVHGRFGPKSNEYVPISGKYYGVPYRSLVPKKIENLLIAGRCVSADSTAAGAIRVMPPCMAMGQAAGTAAALTVKSNCTVRECDVKLLQNTLVENGACLGI